MPKTPVKASVRPGLIRIAILAAVIAAVALCVALCTPSNYSAKSGNTGNPSSAAPSAMPPSSPSSAAPAPAPQPPEGKDYVEGLVESVSGETIALRTRSGSATVNATTSTRIVEVTPGQLTDVTPGSCVNVRATPQSAPSGAAITAQSVTITPAVDGNCPPPAGYFGVVASVSGNSIAVNSVGADGQTTLTNVTVASTTSYSKQAPSSIQAIQHGKCLGAQGTNKDGVLQATTISLEGCPATGSPHHRFHLPRLPHIHL